MRYLIDEDLSIDVATIARDLGLDAVAVQELDGKGWEDETLLPLAAEIGRCIVTANRDDFRRLTDDFADKGLPHVGVLVVPHTLVRRGPAAIARALAAYEHERGGFPSEYLFDFLRHAG